MKKVIAPIVLALVAVSLTACTPGDTKETGNSPKSTSTNSTSKPAQQSGKYAIDVGDAKPSVDSMYVGHGYTFKVNGFEASKPQDLFDSTGVVDPTSNRSGWRWDRNSAEKKEEVLLRWLDRDSLLARVETQNLVEKSSSGQWYLKTSYTGDDGKDPNVTYVFLPDDKKIPALKVDTYGVDVEQTPDATKHRFTWFTLSKGKVNPANYQYRYISLRDGWYGGVYDAKTWTEHVVSVDEVRLTSKKGDVSIFALTGKENKGRKFAEKLQAHPYKDSLRGNTAFRKKVYSMKDKAGIVLGSFNDKLRDGTVVVFDNSFTLEEAIVEYERMFYVAYDTGVGL